MSSKHTFWVNDELGRVKDAEFLTTYLKSRFHLSSEIDSYGSFVLNINAEWGFGKTYFLINWKNELKSKGFPVIYFNAWESDFSSDPLLAFIAEIDSQLTPFLQRSPKALMYLNGAVSNAKNLIKPSLPILVSILIKKLTGLTKEQINDLIANEDSWHLEGLQLEDSQLDDINEQKESQISEEIVSTVASKAVEKALIQHASVKKSIDFFKKNLCQLVSQLSKLKTIQLPIFIFVDELDRCRPSYAIELLECIKHLFGVRGIYFVIATDSRQLTHSIKAVYGSGFDSTRYLKRFFDQEYSFLPPDNLSFASHLFREDKLDEENKLFLPCQLNQGSVTSNSKFFSLCATYFNLSLRDQEQVYSSLNALRLSYEGETIHLAYALFLIILKHRFSDVFERYSRVGHKTRKLILKEIHDEDSTNQEVLLETIIWSGDSGSRKEILVTTIFSAYIDLSFARIKDIKNDQQSEFMREVAKKLWDDQKMFQDKSIYPRGHDLDSYLDMILRIGQLS